MNSTQSRETSSRRIATPDGGRMLVVELDGTPGSVRTARRVAANFLSEPVPAQSTSQAVAVRDAVVADVLLVVAELVTNACRHAPGPCRLTVTLTDESADVAVRDTGRGHLRVIRHDTPAGYGLLIVARLTSGIHVLPSDGGKTVRASVLLAGPRPTWV